MAIGSAVQKGKTIYVYNEKGHVMFGKPGDKLVGYTATTVSIQRGNTVYVYNEKGHAKFSTTAKR